MKRKKEENEKLIDNIKTHVRRVLMKQGKYSPEMSYQIELLASDLLVFRKIRNMVLDEEQKAKLDAGRSLKGREDKGKPDL